MKSKLPVVKGYRVGNSIKFWCPFCEKWHTHGWVEGVYTSRKKGHVLSHCIHEDSPFKKGGYYLKLMTKGEMMEIKQAMIEALAKDPDQ